MKKYINARNVITELAIIGSQEGILKIDIKIQNQEDFRGKKNLKMTFFLKSKNNNNWQLQLKMKILR